MKKEIKPLYLIIIGALFMLPWYIFEGYIAALLNVGGWIFFLIGVVNGIVSLFKKSKK